MYMCFEEITAGTVKAAQPRPAQQSPGNVNMLLKLGEVGSKGFDRKLCGGEDVSILHLDRCLTGSMCCGTSDFMCVLILHESPSEKFK